HAPIIRCTRPGSFYHKRRIRRSIAMEPARANPLPRQDRYAMTYSFLLVNFNMWGLVERCIGQIKSRVDPGEQYEIVIADNSTDIRFRAPDEFAQTDPTARVVRIEQNNGWVDALNHILPTARGRFVVIMHPDVTLDEGCLGKLRA